MAKVIISKTDNLVTIQTTNKFVNYKTGVLQASTGTSGGRINLVDTDLSQKVLNNFDITQIVDDTDTVFGATVSATITALNAVVNAAPDTLIKSTDKVTSLDGVTASDFTGKSGYAVIVDGTDLNLSTSGKLLFNNHSGIKLDAELDLNNNKIYTTFVNGDIVLDPNGTGDVKLGNYTLDGDQSVGSGQDNYVLTYDHSSTKISLEAAPSGGTNTNIANANLTADDNRTYDQDGNDLIIDPNGGQFEVNDSAGPPTGPEIQVGQGVVQLHGLIYPDTDGTNGQALTTNGSGTLSFTTVSGGVTVDSQSANRLVTCSAVTDTLDGEANLTFNGSTLFVTGDIITTGTISGNGSKLLVSEIEMKATGLSTAGQHGLNAETYTAFTSTVVAGYLYALDATAWVATDATSLATASKGMIGMATSTNSNTGMVIRGICYVATDPGGAIGDVVYLATATGRLTTTAVSTTGNVNRVMGYKIGTNLVFLNPSQDWIEIS